MTAILTAAGDFLTQLVTWVGQVITMVTGNDLLLLFIVAIPIVSVTIGFVLRFVNSGRV